MDLSNRSELSGIMPSLSSRIDRKLKKPSKTWMGRNSRITGLELKLQVNQKRPKGLNRTMSADIAIDLAIGKTTVQSIAKEEDPEKEEDVDHTAHHLHHRLLKATDLEETEERPKRSRKVIVKDRTHLRAAVHHKAARADLHQDRNKSEEINRNNKWKRIETTIDTMIQKCLDQIYEPHLNNFEEFQNLTQILMRAPEKTHLPRTLKYNFQI